MNDQDKSREQLIAELVELRQRVADEGARPESCTAAALLHVAPLGIHVCDSAGRITFVNPSQEAITGYTADELVGTDAWDRIVPGPEKDSLPAHFKHLVSEQPAPTPFFAKNIRKSGAVFDVRIDWNYLRNAQGNVTGFLCIVSDVTEQKRAEVALRESEERYRLLAESIPHPVWRWDAENGLIECNRRWYEYTGQTPDEARGNGWMKALHPDDLPRIAQEIKNRQDAAGNDIHQVEYRLRRAADGSYRWHQSQSIPRRDATGTIIDWFGSATDIDDRKRAEAALSASEARYRRLYQSMMDAFVSVDMNGQIQEFNDAYRQMLGYEPEELLAHTYIDITPDRWHEVQAKIIQEQVLHRGYSDVYEKEYRRKDGTLVPVELRTCLITDDNGRPTAMWAILRDITERKRAEEDLQRANDRLEQRVAVRTAELTKANGLLRTEVEQRRRAEERLAILGRFAEGATQGFGMATVEGEITYVNPFLARLFGAQRPEDVIGRQVATYYPAGYQEQRENDILPTLRRKEPWRREQMMLFPDGQMHPTIHSVFPVLDENGELFRTAAVITDITEVKQVEHALRQSEARYRALVESSPDPVAMSDLKGRLVFASQRAAEQHGLLDPAEMVGRSALDFVAEADRGRFTANIGDLVQTGLRRNAEYKLLRTDGTMFHAEFSSAVIGDATGHPEALMAVYRDITERKQAEEQLALLGRFVESATQGFGMCDLDRRITYVNPTMTRMLGEEKPEDVIGKKLFTYHTRDYMKLRDEAILPALRRDRHWQGELPLVSRDGTVIPTIHNIVLVPDKDGEADHFAVVVTDITDRKRAEAKLHAEQQALRRMVLASDRERHLITYELHDGVAQEILGAMMLFESQPPSKERKSKGTGNAYREGIAALRRASSEVRRVMNWLRTPVLDRFGLAAAIEDVAAQLRLTPGAPVIDYRHAVKFKRLEPTLENTLFRIAQEAMTNACRHSQSEKVVVKLTQQGDDVLLEVRDWGIGFHSDTVAENRFGLEGIRERCRILGGKLNIKSEPGKGTVVRVKCPVIEAADPG